MKMSGLEKRLVNRPSKGHSNVAVVRRGLRTAAGSDISQALEIGCGAGEVSEFLARECGYDVVGIDVDPAQVALARSRHGDDPRLQFVVGDAGRLDFGAGRFDLVVAQNVFHHMPDWRRTVTEIGRVLRPSGYVLWLDLTPPPLLAALLRPLARQFGVYTLRDVRTAFREGGFVEIAVRQTMRWIPIRHELILRKRLLRSLG